MRSVLLVLLSILSQCAASCPASCMLCSEDAVICHKLSVIIGVPLTTRALILTDGQISSVDNSAFTGLTNLTLLALSNNIIVEILNNAFQNLSAIRTLLLDHNKITTSSFPDSTFSQLQNLEILQLGNNALQDINGRWFQNTRSLLKLQLEGNLMTRVESGTFSSSDLKNLKTLDLSGNLITYISKDGFHNLPQLHSLDLSRNSLHSAPDAFSSLPLLSKLSLVLNQWNCTCELWELSSFLRGYLQTPGKELYNSQQLVCLSSANSAVLNVVQLTEANCMPPNESITMHVKKGDRITMEQYIRDMSLVAIFFFGGGMGVVIAALYCKMELSNNKGLWRNRSTDVVTSGEDMLNQGVPWRGFNDNNIAQILPITNPGNAAAKLMQFHEEETSNPSHWLREMTRRDQKQTRLDSCFVCHNCNQDGLVPSGTRGYQAAGSSKAIVVQGDSWLVTTSGKHKKLAPREEERTHKPRLALKSNEDCPDQSDQAIYHRQYSNGNHDFHMMPTILKTDAAEHGSSNQSMFDMGHRNTSKLMNSVQSRVRLTAFKEYDKFSRYEGKLQNIQALPNYLITKCMHCNQTFEYRQGHSRETGKSMEDQSFEQQHTREENAEGRINHKQGPIYVEGDYRNHPIRRPCLKATPRRVSFDMRESGALNTESHKMEARTQNIKKSDDLKSALKLRPNASDKNKVGKKLKVHSNSLLKVKINLNPFRKSRIHAQKNQNKEERLLKKNEKAASTMVKGAKFSIRAKKGNRDLSETTNTHKDTNTHKPEKRSRKQPKKFLQNKHSQTTDSTEMVGSQKLSIEDKELLNQELENKDTKQASSTVLYSLQDNHPDGLQITVNQPQNNKIDGHSHTDTTDPAYPCTEIKGTSVIHTRTSHSQPVVDVPNPGILNGSRPAENLLDGDNLSDRHSMTAIPSTATIIQEYLPSAEGSPNRKIRLILPERTLSRSQTPLDKKIR